MSAMPLIRDPIGASQRSGPSGGEWQHDGFRVIARKKGAQVRLYSRPGNDLTYRFPLTSRPWFRLRSRSCIIDGGRLPVMTTGSLLSTAFVTAAMMKAFSSTPSDLIELNGDDLRSNPLEGRKATLEIILANAGLGIRFNEHMENDGSITIADHKTSVSLENEYWDCLRAIAAERGVRLGALVAAARNVP
jgi:ATP-dependent DNA ligase